MKKLDEVTTMDYCASWWLFRSAAIGCKFRGVCIMSVNSAIDNGPITLSCDVSVSRVI